MNSIKISTPIGLLLIIVVVFVSVGAIASFAGGAGMPIFSVVLWAGGICSIVVYFTLRSHPRTLISALPNWKILDIVLRGVIILIAVGILLLSIILAGFR